MFGLREWVSGLREWVSGLRGWVDVWSEGWVSGLRAESGQKGMESDSPEMVTAIPTCCNMTYRAESSKCSILE